VPVGVPDPGAVTLTVPVKVTLCPVTLVVGDADSETVVDAVPTEKVLVVADVRPALVAWIV
jgi:hypothetical protein